MVPSGKKKRTERKNRKAAWKKKSRVMSGESMQTKTTHKFLARSLGSDREKERRRRWRRTMLVWQMKENRNEDSHQWRTCVGCLDMKTHQNMLARSVSARKDKKRSWTDREKKRKERERKLKWSWRKEKKRDSHEWEIPWSWTNEWKAWVSQ